MEMWAPRFLDGLAAQHRVVVFDNRGMGDSTGRGPFTIEQMADDAAGLMKALGCRRYAVLGFSMGTLVVQAAARRSCRRTWVQGTRAALPGADAEPRRRPTGAASAHARAAAVPAGVASRPPRLPELDPAPL